MDTLSLVLARPGSSHMAHRGPTSGKTRRIFFGALALALVAVLFVHVATGTSMLLTPMEVVRQFVRGPQGDSDANNFILWNLRMPRALVCTLVGGLLGSVGCVFQALLRNPLADPYVVGVSSGAALGGVAVLITGVGEAFGNLGIALGGCVTGILTLGLVYRLALRNGAVDVRVLLLSGVVIGSLLSAVLSLILLMGGKNEADILHWLLGDTSTASWPKVVLLSAALAVGFALLYSQSRQLNAFAMGEGVARRLGVDVARLTRLVLLVGGAMTAVAVGTVGIIAFIGLVAPHIARQTVGVDWRAALPASLGIGALLLLAADAISQRLFTAVTHQPGMDLPVGIVTSILGAPSLLLLLRKT